jgi:RHS repeat-associated protein
VKRADGTVLYYVSDDPGNVVGLVNASNQEVARYRYDPFGAVEYSSDPTLQPLGYHGAYRDAENLVYLRNRWYDPELQRFLSEDPIGLAGGINRYSFVGNGPMDGRDPSGLCPEQLVASVDADGKVVYTCPSGGAVPLSGIVATAPSWPFSTPRSSGANANPSSRGSMGGWYSGYTGNASGNSLGLSGGWGSPGAYYGELEVEPLSVDQRCLARDPALPYIAPFSLTPAANLKLPGEPPRGGSRWTSLDRRLPSRMAPSVERGAVVSRGTAGRLKYLGRYGTAAAGIGGFATAYTLTAVAQCVDG